jgi:hypothetical protein
MKNETNRQMWRKMSGVKATEGGNRRRGRQNEEGWLATKNMYRQAGMGRRASEKWRQNQKTKAKVRKMKANNVVLLK